MDKTEPGMYTGTKPRSENETQECWNLPNRATLEVNMAHIPTVQTYNECGHSGGTLLCVNGFACVVSEETNSGTEDLNFNCGCRFDLFGDGLVVLLNK